MVKKVMKSNEKRAVKAENAERRHRNLIFAAVALTAANPVQFGRTFRKNRLCLHGTVTEY